MMGGIFVLDACALIALLAGESGAHKVRDIIEQAIYRKILLRMNQVNLLEVYYHVAAVYDQDVADRVIRKIREYPIEIMAGLSKAAFREAGRIKSTYKIPLGDSIAAAECVTAAGTLVTSDHTNFEKLEAAENIAISWFR